MPLVCQRHLEGGGRGKDLQGLHRGGAWVPSQVIHFYIYIHCLLSDNLSFL